MAKQVQPIPAGYHSITPYLICDDAAKAIEFYQKAFGAIETVRMPGPNGKVAHAEIKIGDSHIMIADENPEMRSAKSLGGSPMGLVLYVEDADAVTAKAVSSGARMTRPMKDEFYGDRAGAVIDPFGFSWHIHTHTRDVTPEELKKAMESMQPVG